MKTNLPSLAPLAALLKDSSPGLITEELEGEVVTALAACWDALDGARKTSMDADKLGRAECFEWKPPYLCFIIERHGAAVLGSRRAEKQRWCVDVQRGKAFQTPQGYRQLTPNEPRLDVVPIATEICDVVKLGPDAKSTLVVEGKLVWISAHKVRIKQGEVIPAKFLARQTVASRRRRFKLELTSQMKANAWTLVGDGRFLTFEKRRD